MYWYSKSGESGWRNGDDTVTVHCRLLWLWSRRWRWHGRSTFWACYETKCHTKYSAVPRNVPLQTSHLSGCTEHDNTIIIIIIARSTCMQCATHQNTEVIMIDNWLDAVKTIHAVRTDALQMLEMSVLNAAFTFFSVCFPFFGLLLFAIMKRRMILVVTRVPINTELISLVLYRTWPNIHIGSIWKSYYRSGDFLTY